MKAFLSLVLATTLLCFLTACGSSSPLATIHEEGTGTTSVTDITVSRTGMVTSSLPGGGKVYLGIVGRDFLENMREAAGTFTAPPVLSDVNPSCAGGSVDLTIAFSKADDSLVTVYQSLKGTSCERSRLITGSAVLERVAWTLRSLRSFAGSVTDPAAPYPLLQTPLNTTWAKASRRVDPDFLALVGNEGGMSSGFATTITKDGRITFVTDAEIGSGYLGKIHSDILKVMQQASASLTANLTLQDSDAACPYNGASVALYIADIYGSPVKFAERWDDSSTNCVNTRTPTNSAVLTRLATSLFPLKQIVYDLCSGSTQSCFELFDLPLGL